MNNVASMTMPSPASSRLPYWAGSVVLHVGAFTLVSVLSFSVPVEKSLPVVKVTLLAPASVAEDAAHQPPPMLQAQRQPRPIQPMLPSPPRLTPPPQPTLMARVMPQPLPPPSSPPVQRRTLQDQRAIDTLQLKAFTKVAARRSAPPASAPVHTSSLPLSTPQIRVPTNIAAPSVPRSPKIATENPAAKPRMLLSAPTGSPSTSRVGLGRTIPPVYPAIAKREGWEGKVLLRVEVQPDGRPGQIIVRRSSGHRILDNAAIDTVKKWRFHPAKDGNIPIRSLVDLPINFVIKKQG